MALNDLLYRRSGVNRGPITGRATVTGPAGQAQELVQAGHQTMQRKFDDKGNPILTPAGRRPFIRVTPAGLSNVDNSFISGSAQDAYKSMQSQPGRTNMLDLGEGQFVAARLPERPAVNKTAQPGATPAAAPAGVAPAARAPVVRPTGLESAAPQPARSMQIGPRESQAMDYQRGVQERSVAKLGQGVDLVRVSPGGFKTYRRPSARERSERERTRGLAGAGSEAARYEAEGRRQAAEAIANANREVGLAGAAATVEATRIGAQGGGLAGAQPFQSVTIKGGKDFEYPMTFDPNTGTYSDPNANPTLEYAEWYRENKAGLMNAGKFKGDDGTGEAMADALWLSTGRPIEEAPHRGGKSPDGKTGNAAPPVPGKQPEKKADQQQPMTGKTKVYSPQTEADFDALPPGSLYRDPDDGKLYTK